MNNYLFLLLIIVPVLTTTLVVLFIVIPKLFSNSLKNKMQELGGLAKSSSKGDFTVDNKTITLKYFPANRNRSAEFRLSTTSTFGADLVIRQETSLDTFWMNIGLNKEAPILDQELAHKFYFECDVPEFLNQLLSNADVKAIIVDILTSFDFIEITKNTCTFKRYPSGALENISNEVITDASRKLLRFVNLIPQTVGMPHPELANFKIWRFILYFVSISATVLGVIFLIWGGLFYRVVDNLKAWSLTAEWFLIIFSVISYVAFFKIKGFSTSSRVFIRFIIFFGLGLLLCLRFGGAVYNGYFDKSPVLRHNQFIIDKYISHSKNNTYYNLTASSWHEGMKGWSFQISSGVYSHVRLGETQCLIMTKAGRLGFEWVMSEKVRISSQQTWTPTDYSQWYPLPGNTSAIPLEEYTYLQNWHGIMEDGITNRMKAQTDLDGWHTAEEYKSILNEFERQQRKMLDRLKELDAPPRLQQFKDEVLNAGDDQILYYKDYAQAKIRNNDLKPNEFLNNDHLRSSDQKLHAADNYFKSLYPSMDKATNDAIERRIAWFDII